MGNKSSKNTDDYALVDSPQSYAVQPSDSVQEDDAKSHDVEDAAHHPVGSQQSKSRQKANRAKAISDILELLQLSSTQDKTLEDKLSKQYALLEAAALEFVKSRQDTADLLISLADELSMHHRNAQAAKISGGVAGIVGSGLAIAGFAASFFTFGVSLALVGAGAAIGAAGGLTAVGGIATELISSKLTGEKAKVILQKDNNACNKLIEALESVKTHQDLQMAVRASGGILGGGKNVLNVVNSVCNIVKVGSLTLEAAEGAGQTAFKVATSAGKGFAIAGAVFSVVTIPIDLYLIISSAQFLHNKTVPQVAQTLYDTVETLDCPSEKSVILGITELKLEHLKHIKQAKAP